MTSSHFAAGEFARTLIPTPVLNSPDFDYVFGGSDGASLPLDDQGLLRQIEVVLLKDTKVRIVSRAHGDICSITTADYPGEKLYIDCRFLESADEYDPERLKVLPSRARLLERLHSLESTPYVWGGNWSAGVPEIFEFYPPRKNLDPKLKSVWALQGVDCSGLLYEATEGATPRNTSQLVTYGIRVPVEDKNLEQIIPVLKPLDLIVWKGHVVIVSDGGKTIESRAGAGVVTVDLKQRLSEIMATRKPANDWYGSEDLGERFVVRRWHPETRFL